MMGTPGCGTLVLPGRVVARDSDVATRDDIAQLEARRPRVRDYAAAAELTMATARRAALPNTVPGSSSPQGVPAHAVEEASSARRTSYTQLPSRTDLQVLGRAMHVLDVSPLPRCHPIACIHGFATTRFVGDQISWFPKAKLSEFAACVVARLHGSVVPAMRVRLIWFVCLRLFL